ncbi:MAG: glycosyltransferase [Patescibacteria group bacterium]|nr:glycosyltransferase [Patescibacteria group bacterium]
MKILTIAATPFFSDRGCHIRIYNEAKYLGKMGAKVRLCTYHLGKDVPELDVARIRGSKWYKKTTPGFSWGKIWLDWKLLFLCRREIKKFQPDVIHAHLWEGLAIGYLAKRLAGRNNIPIIFDLQGNIDEEFASYSRRNKLARKFFIWLSNIVEKWADKTVVSSENVPCRRRTSTAIIKDGIDLDLFQNSPELSRNEAEKIESIKKWSRGKKLLVYIGGLSDNKGIGDLMEVNTRELSSRVEKNWKLLLGGFGSDEEKYRKFVEENNLEEFVYFAGKIDYFSLPHYLALASAGIDPKKDSTESSGKIVNLMAAKLPIICFASNFNRARLGNKGFYLNSFDDLGKILENIDGAGKMDYNLEDLSEEKEVQKLFEIFKSLIE